jgi:hypothetical protein
MTFKELSFKGKLGYIWDYYRTPFFFTVVCGVALISLIYTIFIKDHPDNYSGVAIFNQFMPIEDTQMLQNELNTLVDVPKNEQIIIQNFYNDSTDVLDQADLNQKFNTYIFAGQLQLLIADEDSTLNFIDVEYVSPLTEVMSSEELDNLRLRDKLLYAKGVDSEDEQPYAVDITSSALIAKYNLYEGKKVYASFVPMPAENNLKTINVLNEFLK